VLPSASLAAAILHFPVLHLDLELENELLLNTSLRTAVRPNTRITGLV
jgi:hypothetical protein